MRRSGLTGSKAFNLLEIVIVVAIIAILGAIGIPKMSQGSKGTDDSALRGDLAALRNAIDRYAAEHSGALPAVANIANQLTKYTDATGNSVSDAKTPICVYGPYIRSIPPLPIGTKAGSSGISATDGSDVGWLYTEATGKIVPNTGDLKDNKAVPYTSY